MSDHGCRSRRFIVALALSSSAAQAQVGTGMPLRDASVERANFAALDSMARAARLHTERVDSARMLNALPDTVRVGRFRIEAPPEYLDFARDLARRAEARVTSTFQTSAPTRMSFRMRDITEQNKQPRRVMLERWFQGREGAAVNLRVEPGRTEGVDFLLEALAQEHFMKLDSATQRWLRQPLDPGADRHIERSGVYVELATSPNRIVSDCRSGKIDRCREGFAFELPEDPITMWYDAAERRRIGSRSLKNRRRDPNVPRCAEGDDAACIAEMRTWSVGELPAPLTNGARHSLVWVALGLGGDGALDRLQSSRATSTEKRLEETARTSSASLIAAWRDSVMVNRPRPVTASGRTAWAAVMWGGLLGILAMRSSRWRAR